MIFKKPVLSDGITESTFECKRDGLTIRGTIYRPKGDHLPIAIVCHGFMAWQDSVKHYAAFLAEMGYAAFTFDFGWVIQIQHENNYISIYKNNTQLLKKVGDEVRAGESIAITGESGGKNFDTTFGDIDILRHRCTDVLHHHHSRITSIFRKIWIQYLCVSHRDLRRR